MTDSWAIDVLVCGTAAAEGWPGLFCACDACKAARRLGGRNLRSRAAYMIGPGVRVDFGPDSFYHQQRYNLDYSALEALVVSHSHDDHWFPGDLMYRARGFSVVPERPLPCFTGEAPRRRFEATHGDAWDRLAIEWHELRAGQSTTVSPGLAVTAYAGNHDPDEECLNLRFDAGGSRMLIAHDTGWYSDATWNMLAGAGLNLVFIDCTYGPPGGSGGHLGCDGVVRMRDEMSRIGAIASGAAVYATHFSHNGGALHDELVDWFGRYGIGVAYDGMRVGMDGGPAGAA